MYRRTASTERPPRFSNLQHCPDSEKHLASGEWVEKDLPKSAVYRQDLVESAHKDVEKYLREQLRTLCNVEPTGCGYAACFVPSLHRTAVVLI